MTTRDWPWDMLSLEGTMVAPTLGFEARPYPAELNIVELEGTAYQVAPSLEYARVFPPTPPAMNLTPFQHTPCPYVVNIDDPLLVHEVPFVDVAMVAPP